MKRDAAAFATGLGMALASAASSTTASYSYYPEVPDAGGSFATAQSVSPGPWDGIAGSVGNVIIVTGDVADFYIFGLTGGTFNLSFPQCNGCLATAMIEAVLYDSAQTEKTEFYYNETVSNLLLPTGNYYLKVGYDLGATGSEVHSYEVLFAGVPPDGSPIGAPFAIPEPATLALVGLGLAGLGFSRRKQ